MTFLLGIINDLHADLGALQLALARLDELGVDQIVCAGDIVDGGDEPEQVIALRRERKDSREKSPTRSLSRSTLRGRHSAILRPSRPPMP